MSVVVVTHDASGQLLKVCGSWEDYDDWCERFSKDKTEHDTWEAKVYEQ